MVVNGSLVIASELYDLWRQCLLDVARQGRDCVFRRYKVASELLMVANKLCCLYTSGIAFFPDEAR